MLLSGESLVIGRSPDDVASGGGGPGARASEEPDARDGSAPRRLLLVDDHPVFRAGLKQYLNLQTGLAVVGDAPDLPRALALAEALRPDLILLDLSLKDASGLDLLPMLRERGLAMPVIIVSMHEEESYVEQARQAGAAGYAMKARGANDLLATVLRVLDGKDGA